MNAKCELEPTNAHITLNLFKFQCIFCVELFRGLTTELRTFWSTFTCEHSSLLITYSTLVMKSTNNSFLLIVSLRLYLVGKYSVRHEKPSIDNKTQLMEEIISHLKLHCEIFHWIELHQYVLHCRFNYATFITSFEYIWRGCSTHYFAQHTEILKLTSPLSFICWPSMHYVSLFQIPIEPSNTIHNLM